MNFDALLEELIGLLEASGIKVRRESLEESRGGLCRLGGTLMLFLDEHADSLQSAAVCARALCKTVDITTIYLRPNVREFIEAAVCDQAEG